MGLFIFYLFLNKNRYMEVAYNSDDLYQLSKLREDKKQLAEIRGGKVVRRQMPKQGT